MRNALHSSRTTHIQPTAAEAALNTALNLVLVIDGLVPRISDDPSMPPDVAYHLRAARDELALAHNSLLHAAANEARQPLNHYQALAREAGAVQAAGGVA